MGRVCSSWRRRSGAPARRPRSCCPGSIALSSSAPPRRDSRAPGCGWSRPTAPAQGIAPAFWALARIDLQRGKSDDALARIDRFLVLAGPDDPGLSDARAARSDLLQTTNAAALDRLRKRVAIGALSVALVLAL